MKKTKFKYRKDKEKIGTLEYLANIVYVVKSGEEQNNVQSVEFYLQKYACISKLVSVKKRLNIE